MEHSSRHFVEQCLYLPALHLCNSAGQVLRARNGFVPGSPTFMALQMEELTTTKFATKFGYTMRGFRLSPSCKGDLRSSGMLCSGDQ